jgi:MFS transporter, ACS family, hexuronate transporter
LWLIAFWFTYYTPGKTAKGPRPRLIPPLKLLKTRFVFTFTLSKIFLDPVWYFVTFWIGRYLADVYHWNMKQIGWYAIIPFLIADVGNLIGGYFTQFIIRQGVPIPKARKLAVAISGGIMGLSLLLAPWVVTTPMSALIIFGISGFGFTAYNANSLAYPADVVPKTSAASVWGLACVGAGLGGALFQSLSGLTVKKISATAGYTTAYNYLFIGYGILALIGVFIILFLMGPLHKNQELHDYVEKSAS